MTTIHQPGDDETSVLINELDQATHDALFANMHHLQTQDAFTDEDFVAEMHKSGPDEKAVDAILTPTKKVRNAVGKTLSLKKREDGLLGTGK